MEVVRKSDKRKTDGLTAYKSKNQNQNQKGPSGDHYGLGSVFKLKRDNLVKFSCGSEIVTHKANAIAERDQLFRSQTNASVTTPSRLNRLFKSVSSHKYTYILGKGNNENVIRRV